MRTFYYIQNLSNVVAVLYALYRAVLTHCGLEMQYCKHRPGATLVKIMACCLMAPSHYLNQCRLINQIQCQLSEGNFRRDTSAINN